MAIDALSLPAFRYREQRWLNDNVSTILPGLPNAAAQPRRLSGDLVDNGATPSGRLRKSNSDVASAFQNFRDVARTAGPLDTTTVEFILMAGFSTAGHQEPFKNHAIRALQAGVTKEALQQVVTLGATSVLPAVANALRWIDEVCADIQSG